MTAFSGRVLGGLGVALPRMAGSLLTSLVTALTGPADDIDVRVQPAAGGWPTLLDLNTSPEPAWLGQLAGVKVDTTASLAAQRAAVLAHPMWKRGTPAAVIALAQTFLTGTKRVDLFERDAGDPWALRVRIFTPQLVDPTTTPTNVAAILTQTKPVGIALTVEVFPGATFALVQSTYATFADVTAAVPNFTDLLTSSL